MTAPKMTNYRIKTSEKVHLISAFSEKDAIEMIGNPEVISIEELPEEETYICLKCHREHKLPLFSFIPNCSTVGCKGALVTKEFYDTHDVTTTYCQKKEA